MNKLLKAHDAWAEIQNCDLQEPTPPYTKHIVSYFAKVVGMVSNSESITSHTNTCFILHVDTYRLSQKLSFCHRL